MIRTLDEWALRRACQQITRWELEGVAPIPLSVNVSPKHFWDTEFAAVVESALTENGIAPARLALELSEGSLGDDVHAMAAALVPLRERGVALSLDGIGTGTTPLPALTDLPFGSLKIARSVIASCQGGAREARLATAVIALAKSLALDVVAVGVEEPEQRAFLLERGCTAMQGSLFAPPLEAGDINALLLRGRIPSGAK